MRETLAIIALGANFGDARDNVDRAILRLQELSAKPLKKSSLWQTAPMDCPPGSPTFVNAVVALVPQPNERPETLMPRLKALEQEFGRRPKQVLNEPRPLDLDLISFGDEVRDRLELRLPHPRAHLRRFVLQPLNEIAPDLILPGQTKTVAELLSHLPANGIQKLPPT